MSCQPSLLCSHHACTCALRPPTVCLTEYHWLVQVPGCHPPATVGCYSRPACGGQEPGAARWCKAVHWKAAGFTAAAFDCSGGFSPLVSFKKVVVRRSASAAYGMQHTKTEDRHGTEG